MQRLYPLFALILEARKARRYAPPRAAQCERDRSGTTRRGEACPRPRAKHAKGDGADSPTRGKRSAPKRLAQIIVLIVEINAFAGQPEDEMLADILYDFLRQGFFPTSFVVLYLAQYFGRINM
jgi:hypothetical protein